MTNGEKLFLALCAAVLVVITVMNFRRRTVNEVAIPSPEPEAPIDNKSEIGGTGVGPKYLMLNSTPWGMMPPIMNFLPKTAPRSAVPEISVDVSCGIPTVH